MMLRAAGRLIRADLAQRPLQAALTGLVVAIAAGALLVTLYLRAVLDDPFADLMRATNGAHVTVFGPREAVARAAALPEVAEAGEPARLVRVAAGVSPARGRLVLGGLPERAAVDRPRVIAGRAPRERGEVMLNHALALGAGLDVGDELRVGGDRLAVVGVALLPMPTADGWVTPAHAVELKPAPPAPGEPDGAQRPVAGVALRLRDPDAAAAVAERLAAQPDLRVTHWLDARDDFTDESRRTLAILGASTLLALLATGFTLATAIGGRVLSDRRRIGLLRTVGVTPRGVMGTLVGHYLALALIAAPVGLAGGWLLAPPLLGDTLALLGTPQPGPPGAALAAQVLALVLVAVTVACALPAWRAGRLAPVIALAPVRPAATERASRAAQLVRALRLPVVAALGAKDAYVQRTRAVLTMASLAVAAMIVVCALAFEATMDRLAADPALRAQPWDLAVETESLAPERVDRLLADVPGIAEVGRRYAMPASAGPVQLETRVIDGSPAAFAFAVPDGRGARRAGEATLGRGAFEALGVEIGDRLTLSAAGRSFDVRVVGRHVEPEADGLTAVMPAGGVPAAALAQPGWIVRVAAAADPAAVEAEIRRQAGASVLVQRTGESFGREVAELRPVVYGVTALLLAIAAVNLLTTLLLGVRERRRDVAILGAVGASRRQVTATVIAGGVLLALPSVVAGLPLGAWMFRTVVGITDPSDGPDVATLPEWWVLVAALPVALAAVAAVSALAAREAARVTVAAALRAE
jgi:putative ABC transport system permease protein